MTMTAVKECPVTFTITAHLTDDDPPVAIYNTCLEKEDGIWRESFGSLEQLHAYIRGVRSTSDMLNHLIPEPEIPRMDI